MREMVKEARQLFVQQKMATLATLMDGHPYASLVTYAPTPEQTGALLLLSRLAVHTKNILQDARASLLVVERSDAERDPQTLARICLLGSLQIVARSDAAYSSLADAFRAKVSSEHLFALADFELFRLQVTEARYVGGFARATTISGKEWSE
jgi:putative heme iron utilization protein